MIIKYENEYIKTKMNNEFLITVRKIKNDTGKTSIAPIIAVILYKLGYSKINKFKETTVLNFLVGYVGQTAIK